MNSYFYKQNFELIKNNRKILNNTKFLKKNSITFASSSSISWSNAPEDEAGKLNYAEQTVQKQPMVNKSKQKKKSLQYILKNLKFLHFQQKNQVQSSVLTYPIKDFLKKHPSWNSLKFQRNFRSGTNIGSTDIGIPGSGNQDYPRTTNFLPFFPLDCALSLPLPEGHGHGHEEDGQNKAEAKSMDELNTQNTTASMSSVKQSPTYYSPYFVVKEEGCTTELDVNRAQSILSYAEETYEKKKVNKWFDSVTKQTKLKSSKEDLTKIFTVPENFSNFPPFSNSNSAEESGVPVEEDSSSNWETNSDTPKVSNPALPLDGYVEKLKSSEKVPLMKYSKLHELKLVTISIASPEKMKEWAEKTLPNGKVFGEVTNANTLHYKTFKPHKGGLFCERIFGPLKDFECACGIYSKPNELESKKILQHEQIQRAFCPNCDVEYTWSVIRRYQLGYIQLVSPVSHIWYLKANPSYLSLLLDFKRSFLESIIYCTKSITLENLFKKSEKNLFDTSPKNLYSVWQKLIEEEKFINNTEKLRSNFRKTQKNKKGLIKTQIFQKTFKIQKRFKIAKLKNSQNFQLEQLASLWRCPEGKNRTLMKTMLQTKFNYSVYVMNNIFIYVLKSMDSHSFVPLAQKSSGTQSKKAEKYTNLRFNAASPFDQLMKFKNQSNRTQKRNFWKFSSMQYRVSLRVQKIHNNQLFIQNFNSVQRAKKVEEYGGIEKLQNQSSTMFSKKSKNNFLLKNSFSLFYFKKIYSEILQTKEKIHLEILFSNFINLNKSKSEDFFGSSFQLSDLLIDSTFSAIQSSSETEELKNKLLQNLHTNNAKNRNFKKSLVQNSLFIFFIGFFFSKGNLRSKKKELFKLIKNFEKLFPLMFVLSSANKGTEQANLNWVKTSQFFQKFLKQVLCLSFLNRKFDFVKLTTSSMHNRKDQVQNCFYAFFLNFKVTNVFSLNDIQKNSFNNKPLNVNKALKFFYYTSGLKLTKKIEKISKILNSMNLNFSINSKKNVSIYNNLKRNKSFKNFKLIYFFFEIFHSSFLNTSSFSLNETNDLPFANQALVGYQLGETDFSLSSSSQEFQRNSRSGTNSCSMDKETPGLELIYRNKLVPRTTNKNSYTGNITNSLKKEFKLESRKKALFLKKQKEIQFQKLSNLFKQKTDFKKFCFGIQEKNVPNSFFSKKFLYGMDQFLIPFDFRLPSGQADGNQTVENNFLSSSRKKLKNPLYTVSYFYAWPSELDWKSFMYYNSENLSFHDKPIAVYRNGTFQKFPGETTGDTFWSNSGTSRNSTGKGINSSVAEADRKRTFPKKTSIFMHETNNQLMETLTGASLIQKLLTELDSVEFQKMIKQHQVLIPIVNRSIRKLSKNLGEFGPFSPEGNKKGSLLSEAEHDRPKVSQTKSDLLKIQKLLQKRDHIIRRFKFLSKISWASFHKVESSAELRMRNLTSEFLSSPEEVKRIRYWSQQNTNPASMILTILPVLPPDLRPILKLQNQIAASDLNRLYQRIIYRNERLKKFLKDPSTSQSFEMKYAQRLLQEAVDNLIENGKGSVKPETNARGQALKSLSEILKGKQGRFRQYLLGKRVDYSGRSVIVVGPSLKLSECGLPLRIAIELFLPFLIKKILHYKLAKTVIGAKNFIYKNNDFTWNLLNEIMKNHPILLNRAPTLHRLGIQAFLPKLIHGQAILLHPLVCPAFNADFDGDQMAVHVPITVEARTEAWSFLFSRNHLLSAATGEPIILPSQDMVLGCYYLTSENATFKLSSTSWSSTFSEKLRKQKIGNSQFMDKSKWVIQINQPRFQRKCFYNWDSVLNAYQKNQILLQSVIWVRWNGKMEFSNESFSSLEIRVNSFGHYEKIKSKFVLSLKPFIQKPYLNQFICNQYIRTTPGRVLMNNVIQNCMRF